MKRYIPLIFCMSAALFAHNDNKVLNIKKTDTAPVIDGIIDDCWELSETADDFFQLMPYFGNEPTNRTVARILTTQDALYCMIVCYDDDGRVQAYKGSLDNISGDHCSLMLDTFGNGRTAYKFGVSASGVRSDCRLIDDARNRDYTWDGIWFSGAKVYDWGFVVEMKIPYKSLQYNESLLSWGLDFDRYDAELKEDLYWCCYEESEGQRVSKFGKLYFNGFRPTIRGMHLELYPVGLVQAEQQEDGSKEVKPNAGLDVLYNPSPKLVFQGTVNPDFAQIEADPFEFNISRYETYFDERRPFFTEGNEIFMASGRQRNMGFYRPMELFYSRRIGRKLPDGSEVPLWAGAKTFGRAGAWEYGAFTAFTGEREYETDEETSVEERAVFGSARLKKQIMGNSSVGLLFVGKHTASGDNGVIDVDGAFRGSNWQLAYQIARSYRDDKGDFAGSAGFTMISDKAIVGVRSRVVGNNFDIDDVGFVPWRGTAELVGLAGPRWYFQDGYIRSILCYVGPILNYEKVDAFTDYGALFGFNMQFRTNWGFEINTDYGRSKELDVTYDAYSFSFSNWYNVNPRWNASFNGGYAKTYNFSRDYLADYLWLNGYFQWQVHRSFNIGTSAGIFAEGNPQGSIEEITYNSRPFISANPINNMNVRIYLDNLWFRSSGEVEQLIGGLLFSYNFSPKSWIYLAINELQYRPGETLKLRDRAAVFKLKYLYYM
ncbi:carbohydrate binding family 9 domain-containing protein [bacterium]|nr:carbohydrate binding family 9 domain-containing protein [bacterium]